ncbi:MAG: GntR family transcriptional regulator [Candidatus Dormibacteraceae bacterium]
MKTGSRASADPAARAQRTRRVPQTPRGSAGVPTGDLSDFAYAALSEDILTGHLAAGVRLTQTALSAQLGISRTPVREAMLRLQEDGLLQTPIEGGKPIVAPLDADELEELYLILGVLEGLAARLATRRLTGLAAARLRHALQQESKHETEAFPGEHLHLTIVEASGSTRLMRQVRAIRTPISRYRNIFLSNPPAQDRSHTYHEQIVEAIVAGQGDTAERLVIQHMADAFAEIVDALREDIHPGTPSIGIGALTLPTTRKRRS